MQVSVFDRQGARHELANSRASSVMEVIRDEGLTICAQCGGCVACGTCHVYVDAAWLDKLPPISTSEAAMLEFVEELRPESRLSCQLKACEELNGILVTLAPGTEY